MGECVSVGCERRVRRSSSQQGLWTDDKTCILYIITPVRPVTHPSILLVVCAGRGMQRRTSNMQLTLTRRALHLRQPILDFLW